MRWFANVPLLLPCFIFCGGEVRADSLQQTLSARASEEYITNPLLNPALQGLSAWRSTFDPNYKLTKVSGADQLTADLDLLLVHSSNTSIIADGGFPTATFGWTRQADKGKFDVTTSYNVASTMLAMPGTVGIVSANSTSTSKNLSADWSRDISERTTLTLNGAYTNTTFSGNGNTTLAGNGNSANLYDFVTQTGGVKLNYALNEHNATFMNLSYVNFAPSGSGPNSRVYNAGLGLNWSVTERMDWTLQAGPSRMESPGSAGTTTTTTSLQGAMIINYRGQQSNLILNANRQATPSGLNAIVMVDQANGSFSYDLSERSKTGLDLGWSKYDALPVSFYRTSGIWLRHDLSTSWWMKTYINHNTNVLGSLNPATSNMIGISIAYTNF